MPIDKRNILDNEPFDYKVLKDNKVQIFWHNKLVIFLKGKRPEELLKK